MAFPGRSRLTALKERKEFFRNKLEELLAAYRGYTRRVATTVWSPWHLVMDGILPYEAAEALSEKS
jgi:hypothetical protein